MTKGSLITTIICTLLACWLSPLQAQNYRIDQRGIAVYYADYLEGQPTAYGEIYRRNEMTAAHRTHPAGTMLRVTRLDTGRSVTVRVNDRGAFCDGCVVDLSKAAAIQLDLVRTGKAMVSLEVVGQQPSSATVSDYNVNNPNIALYERPTYNQPANRHSSYPRPDAGFQSGNIYVNSAPSSYDNTASQRITARSPVTTTAPTPDPARSRELQVRGLNAYNQIEAFDSYNYYQAQQAERRPGNAGTTVRSDKETYERLRARGLLPEEKTAANDPSFYARGGVPQPSSYDQVSEPVVSAKSPTNPSAYIQFSNTPTSTARPEAYSSTSSFPQTYSTAIADRGSYAIQFASYRNFDNAQRQLQKLKQMGLATAYLLETNHRGEALYKVLNGPFGDKDTASSELVRYKRELLLDGIVILL